MPTYNTYLEKDLKKQMDKTRDLVEKLYKVVGSPDQPPDKRVRVGYRGYKTEKVWMTSDDMLTRIIAEMEADDEWEEYKRQGLTED